MSTQRTCSWLVFVSVTETTCVLGLGLGLFHVRDRTPVLPRMTLAR